MPSHPLSVLAPSFEVEIVATETVAWEGLVNFDDFGGSTLRLRTSSTAFVSGGKGTIRVLVGGASLDPGSGAQVVGVDVASVAPTAYDVIGAAFNKPSGSQLVKLSIAPPAGADTIRVRSSVLAAVVDDDLPVDVAALQNNFRALLVAFVTTGFPIPPGLEGEFVAGVSQAQLPIPSKGV